MRRFFAIGLLVGTTLAAQTQKQSSLPECQEKLAPLLTGFKIAKLAPGQVMSFGVQLELSERSEARKFSERLGKDWEDKIPDNPSPLEFETCQGILAGLYPGEKAMFLSGDGSVFATHTEDGLTYVRQFNLPAAARSGVALASVGQTLEYAQRLAETNAKGPIAAYIPDGRTLWFALRDTFCFFHPDVTYVDLFNNREKCPHSAKQPDEETMLKDFEHAQTFRSNYVTFLNGEMTKRLGREAMQELVNDLKSINETLGSKK